MQRGHGDESKRLVPPPQRAKGERESPGSSIFRLPMAGKEESDLPGEAAPGSDKGPGADPSATFADTLASVRRHLKTPDLSKTLHGSGPSPDLSARIPSSDSRQSAVGVTSPALWALSRDKAQEGQDSGLPPIANAVPVRLDHPADVTPIGGRPLPAIATIAMASEAETGGSARILAPAPIAAAASTSTHIPFRVGPYEVATRIAQGGMGSIYVCRRADMTDAGRLFTLKVVRQHQAQKGAAVHAFNREARVGALFRHPNAQTVLDTGVYDNQPFLILPYIEGASLGDLLADDGARPPPSVIVTVLLDVLRALQHAHRVQDEKHQPVGLVHADVSPDNVLIGVDGVARLTDFGSAHFATDGITETPEASGLGKASYMAPEQLRGEVLDGRTDIFAVGVMMWTALTGQKLFAAETYDQTVMRVMRKRIPAPSGFGAPSCLDDVCFQALSRSLDLRFATADHMADALMTAAADTDLVASRAEVEQWVRREAGEMLAERRRRIGTMFGDATKTPGPMVATMASPAPRPGPSAERTRLPAATIQIEAVNLPARMVVSPPPDVPDSLPQPKTTLKQWYLIVTVSVAVFFATLIIASMILKPLQPRRRPPQNSSAVPVPAESSPTGTIGR